MPARSYIVWPQGGPFAPVITTTTVPGATTGVPYSFQMAAVGGKPPYVWSKPSASGSGLTLSMGGVLTGTPTTSGPFTLVIKATDTLGVPSTPTNVTVVTISGLTISTASLPGAVVGTAYTATATASGGT